VSTDHLAICTPEVQRQAQRVVQPHERHRKKNITKRENQIFGIVHHQPHPAAPDNTAAFCTPMNYSLAMDNTHTAESDDSDIPGNSSEYESYIHSCAYCEKIVLSLDYDLDMWCEENEWANIHFSITLGDVLEAFRAGCEFAEGLFSSHTLLERGLPETLTLCAHFQDHTMDPSFCDHVGLFGLWNAAAKKVEYTFDSYEGFSVCTSSGTHLHFVPASMSHLAINAPSAIANFFSP
jgi:hypothetical protein